MYQRAFNDISAYGLVQGQAAQKLSTLIHGVPDDEHPHRETMKSLINKRSPLAPSQQLGESHTTARFGSSRGTDQSFTSQAHRHPSISSHNQQHHGAVVPTGAELSSLYRAPTTSQVPMVVNPPLIPTGGGSSQYPQSQRIPTPPMSSSLAPPLQPFAASGQYQSNYMGSTPVLTGSINTASFGSGGVGPTTMGSAPMTDSHMQSTITLPQNPGTLPVAERHSHYQTAKYEYAPVGQSMMGMASTPVHTPVVHAPGLTPMGRDVEARSGSTNAPAILSRRETERLERLAAKEAQKREKQEEKKEKKKRSCCK